MKKIITISALVLGLVSTSFASDDMHNISIKNAMDSMPADVKTKIGDVKFYFGKDSAPAGTKVVGTLMPSLRTNGFLKDETVSCNRVFYSDLIQMAQDAKAHGGTAVANIQSNWQHNTTSSSETFVCAAGLWMSGVALKADVIK